MLVWKTDPSLRDNELRAAFAAVWCALPKVIFSRTLESVGGNARLAEAPVAEEVAAALEATDKDISIGGARLGAAAIELDLIDDLRMEAGTLGSRVIHERYGHAGTSRADTGVRASANSEDECHRA